MNKQNLLSSKDSQEWQISQKRKRLDYFTQRSFMIYSSFPILLTIAIFIGLIVKAAPILHSQPILSLLSGEVWRPLKGQFGFYPFIVGTVWVTVVAIILAVPICILTALYLSEYAGLWAQQIVKPILDLLAAIPSVVYGVWGVLVIVPWVQQVAKPFLSPLGKFLPVFTSKNPTGYSVFAGGIVLAVMITPFIVSLSYEVLQTIPQGLRQASLALGTTRWQTIKYVVFPVSLNGIFASIILGCSRALGETMAVLMVVGNVAQVPHSIFDSAYPIPALIANNYGEMMSIPLYDSALMAAALILMVMILILNILSVLTLRHVFGEIK
ncbi:MAG: phosphate ABC transporter permease subunit PstC [Anaerolineales bacterium]